MRDAGRDEESHAHARDSRHDRVAAVTKRMKVRLLVVEDEATLALLTSMTLEDEGFEVVVAPDGQKGLEAARAQAPDLIITDFMMPRMDGLEMLRTLRGEGFDAPVVLTSAVPQQQLPIDGEKPFEAYLAKPYHEGELAKLIRRMLDKR